MTVKEVAKLTGYSDNTVRKYALLLGVPYIGEGNRKNYTWQEADVERFLAAIGGTGGRRDRRGETQKFLKKFPKTLDL
jgi:hypothetical protein